jgi:predicted lipoprotein with Yx(FWY)xxD motif
MDHLRTARVLAIAAAAAMIGTSAQSQSQKNTPSAAPKEISQSVPLPPGFQVIHTAEDGPVFATAEGKTLYQWPFIQLRNGDAGDQKGKPTCTDTVFKENAGLMSPYPGGFIMPDADTRLSCLQLWPAVWAPEDAKPVGKWTVVKHPNGKMQWAYDGYPMYTSMLDKKPGDVNGGTARRSNRGSASGALREPVGPPALLPPGFIVVTVATGRLVVTADRASVYTSDRDAPNKSNCYDRCTDEWTPALAPEFAEANGEWGVIERSPGVKQWTFRTKPLYTHALSPEGRRLSLQGSDVPGWHNVYTQSTPFPGKDFTIQDAMSGQVLADRNGKSIYVYNCNDDAWDQQACNHPDLTQAYRLAICGAGSQEKCMQMFPYVLARKDAKSESAAWSIMEIDAKTGHRAKPGQADALRVWAYRDRPVYTFHLDQEPGDIKGDSWGEFQGQRNGFKVIWRRDDYFDNAS